MSAPTMFPTNESTTDQPIQYPKAPIGPNRLNRERQPSWAYSAIPPGLSGNIAAVSA